MPYSLHHQESLSLLIRWRAKTVHRKVPDSWASHGTLKLRLFSFKRHTSEKIRLGNFWLPTLYYSASQTSKSKGVAILFFSRVPCGFWQGGPSSYCVPLVNLYLPIEDQISLLETCLSLVDQHTEGVLIVGGDCNLALNPLPYLR